MKIKKKSRCCTRSTLSFVTALVVLKTLWMMVHDPFCFWRMTRAIRSTLFVCCLLTGSHKRIHEICPNSAMSRIQEKACFRALFQLQNYINPSSGRHSRGLLDCKTDRAESGFPSASSVSMSRFHCVITFSNSNRQTGRRGLNGQMVTGRLLYYGRCIL